MSYYVIFIAFSTVILIDFPRGLNVAHVPTLPVLFLLGVRVSNYIVDFEMTVELSTENDVRGSIPCLM